MGTIRLTSPVVLLWLALFIGGGACTSMSPRCKNLLDVVAVVDGSDSIDDADFRKLKEAVIQISDALDLSETGTMFGAVVYSSTVSETAALSSNSAALRSEISQFGHPKDGTATHLGIRRMTDMMQNQGRADVPKVGIVITDGRSKNPAATQTAAAAARKAGLNMFAVGVGFSINTTELNGIASSLGNVLKLNDFDELLDNVLALVQRVCKVDGNWSEWTVTTGDCSASCGGGSRTISRTRTCTNPAPSNGGDDCVGESKEEDSEECNSDGCPVNGSWSVWTVLTGDCSASCGGGSRTISRTRTCTNPAPSNGGEDCVGAATKVTNKTCNIGGCPVHGSWSEWAESTSTCSASCGGGSQTITRTRTCTDPAPSNGGDDCEGTETEKDSEVCNTGGCPVNGSWSEWAESTSTCSASCGGGSQTITRTRTCTDPAPSNGGDDCEGTETEKDSEVCNTGGCPVNGSWSEWAESTSTCSASCGGGSRTISRTRTCTNPAPSNGGDDCVGESKEEDSEECNSDGCPVNGSWSVWTVLTGDCSASCGGGSKTISRTRTCTNPAPSNGGDDCVGESKEEDSEECNSGGCPVNGSWSVWTVLTGDCTAPCGGGSRTISRTRTCTNPAPSNGGADCVGESTENSTSSCNADECQVDLCDGCLYANGIGYMPYPSDCSRYVQCWEEGSQPIVRPCAPGTLWDQTDLTCKLASAVSCGSPSPAPTTAAPSACNGKREVAGNKAVYQLYVNGHGWLNRPCPAGTEFKAALCRCDTSYVPIPVNGGWALWTDAVTVCSTSCGGGSRTISRTRTCTNPPPQHGGQSCVGATSAAYTESCSTNHCPVHGGWSEWASTATPCSATCGGGSRSVYRGRTCTNPTPAYGGGYCAGSASDVTSQVCNTEPCLESTTSAASSGCRPVAGNAAVYEQLVSGHGWMERPCPTGTEFRVAGCRCVASNVSVVPAVTTTSASATSVCQPEVYLPCNDDLSDYSGRYTFIQNEGVTINDGAASFSRDSGLRIPRFSNVDIGSTLVISFSLRRGENTDRPQAIVSNADCGRQGSIYIIQTSSTVEFILRNKNEAECTLSLPYETVVGYRSRSMTNCRLTVYGGNMTAKVGSETKNISCPGDIAKSQCAMQVGRGTGYDNFTGEIDEFTVSMCRSDVIEA